MAARFAVESSLDGIYGESCAAVCAGRSRSRRWGLALPVPRPRWLPPSPGSCRPAGAGVSGGHGPQHGYERACMRVCACVCVSTRVRVSTCTCVYVCIVHVSAHVCVCQHVCVCVLAVSMCVCIMSICVRISMCACVLSVCVQSLAQRCMCVHVSACAWVFVCACVSTHVHGNLCLV